jgi:DNA invertase Pin-like site-specific DNA recombinase
MIAAVYARKSTEQNVSEDAKSVTRQLEHARAFATERGWTILEEYVDDGVSGAIATKLTGRARMLAAAADEKFSVVVVRDVDRLSRNDEELPGIIYSLRDTGVEVWSYADRARVDTRTAMSRGMLTMKATFAAAEREAAQQRTREAMRGKASRGHVAGGKVYGYRNVRHGDHVEREIVEAEAVVIRRIFHEIIDGRGYARVAQGLNADAVPCPRGQRWAMTCVREMVFRELYRDRLVYGKTRWEYRRGRKFKVRTPESEWIVSDAPALRIVSEELWQAAHARIGRTRQAYLRTTGGKLYGRPETGVESKYLLSGFLVCGACGGGMHVIRRSSQRGRRALYFACNNWRVNHACRNSMSVHTAALDAAILKALRDDVLTEDVVEAVVTRTIALARLEPDEHAARRLSLLAERQRLEAEIRNLTEAVATGAGALLSLVAALKDRERQRAPTCWRGWSTWTASLARRSGATGSAASCARGSPSGTASSAASRRSRARSCASCSPVGWY